MSNNTTNTAPLTLKNDIMFKAFFSKKGHEKFLEDFIGAILNEKIHVLHVVHDARLEQLLKAEKYGVLDLDVELENGKIINLEMQIRDLHNIERRTTFYASKKITEQEGIGKFYEGLKDVIIIVILDYNFLPVPDYVNKTVRVLDKHRDYEINNNVCYYYIELGKFRNAHPDMKNKLNHWLAFIDRERGDLLEMAKKENSLIKEADEDYNVLTGDEEKKRLEWIRMVSAMEEHSALLTAKNEGIAEGKEQRKRGAEKKSGIKKRKEGTVQKRNKKK